MGAGRSGREYPSSTRNRRVAHGTRTLYRDGCRCQPCRRAFARDRNARRQRDALPAPIDAVRAVLRISPAELRAQSVALYLEELRLAGVGLRRISLLTSISRRRLSLLRSGRLTRVTGRTSTRIYTARVTFAWGALVSARRMRRQLRTLRTMGYTRSDIIRRVGASVLRRRRRARVKSVLKVAQWYDDVTRT